MRYEPDGKLLLSWSEAGLDNPPWELRMELLTASNERWGYFSIFRGSDGRAIALDMNALSGEFRAALTKAVERTCSRMETTLKAELDERANKSRMSAAGSGSD